MQAKLCTKRGFQRLRGDASISISSIVGNSIMALIIGSVFYNLPSDTGSFYSRGALLFFAILLNAFSSVLEVGQAPPPPFDTERRLTGLLDPYTVCTTTYCRKTC